MEFLLLIFKVRFLSMFSRVKVGGYSIKNYICDNLLIFLCGFFVFVINFFDKGCFGYI